MDKRRRNRFTYSELFTKTNFTFGNEAWDGGSTYLSDYTSRSQLPHLPYISTNGSPVTSHGGSDVTTEADKPAAPEQLSVADLQSERKKKLQRTNFTFGNDVTNDVRTAYQEFAALPPADFPRRRPFSPPIVAEILPPCEKPPSVRSTLTDDYTYFGPSIHDEVYGGRLNALNTIKNIHTTDSVGSSLQLGKARKIMTRTMVDYQHPLDRVRSNIKKMMAQEISPYVRQDSIWQSVHDSSKPCISTEMRQKFSWPHAQKTRRFLRGHCHKVR